MMNFFGKKKKQQDAIEQADQLMNKGLSGLFMKGLVPKEHREQINQSLNSARQAQTAANGGLAMAATAVIISVTDTGKLVNFDPIVVLVLDVTEINGNRYQKRWKRSYPSCKSRGLEIRWVWEATRKIHQS